MAIIYFDMDGVLCDFDGAYEELTGQRWDHAFTDKTRSEAVRSLSPEEKAQKWAMLNPYPNFFLDLLWYPGSKAMLERVRDRVGIERIGILSAASSHVPQSVEQKYQWLERETPWILPANRLVVKRKRDKTLHAKDNVLVDDFDFNTDRWTKAGGHAVLFFNAAQAEEDINSWIGV
jgi:5'(3')-deoxyribonucleotidase